MPTLEKKTKSYGKQFFSGVAVLAISTFIVKIIGMFYKIPMMEYLGAEGMGYFNSAYEIYSLFFVISTTGIPVAISMLISQNYSHGNVGNAEKVYKTSVIALGALGLIGTAVLCVFHKQLSLLIKSDKASFSILAISPALFMICITSAIRGYFQGKQIMIPTAVSQVIEALGKLVLGLGFAIYAINKGYSIHIAAAFAVFGLTIGIGLSLLYLILFKHFHKPTIPNKPSERVQKTNRILRDIFSIAVPITLSSTILSLSKIIDMSLILIRLADIGYSQKSANAIFGAYSTMAVSVYNLPATLISAIALPLIPMLTNAIETSNAEKEIKVTSSAIKLTAIIAIPSGLGISVFSKQILSLLFSSQTNEIEYTSPLLSLLGLSVFMSAMITVTNAILQAHKEVNKPIISMLVGVAVKVILAFILIGIPEISVYGAPISTLISTITIVSINLYFILQRSPRIDKVYTLFVKPLVASLISISTGAFTYVILSAVMYSRWLMIPILAEIVLIYLLSIIKLKTISSDEILMLPAGEKINRILIKSKLI